ncbi:hypothetical protein ACFYXH_08115 [Streptomyces sp. NPDC002730]|uniref:hypothetical protein n=1 Tax=Streptomyces sp. NPDC002730 TaxID=3364662 RepID=UPI003684E794
MFEIRIICAEPEADQITKALSQTFTTGSPRQHPTRDGHKVRLYITAQHRTEARPWPTPEVAYATAPSIISEIGWTAERAREALWPIGPAEVKEFWLRKAAVLDRIALADEAEGVGSEASDVATEAALRLLDVDRAVNDAWGGYSDGAYPPDNPESSREPRGYVRREYALWAKHQ